MGRRRAGNGSSGSTFTAALSGMFETLIADRENLSVSTMQLVDQGDVADGAMETGLVVVLDKPANSRFSGSSVRSAQSVR